MERGGWARARRPGPRWTKKMPGVSAETFSGYKQRENRFVWNKQAIRTKTKQKFGVVTVAWEISQFVLSSERPLTLQVEAAVRRPQP